MNNKLIALFISCLFALSIVHAQTYYEQATEGTGTGSHSYYTEEDARFPDWYDVSEAELSYCATYGPPAGSFNDYGSVADQGPYVAKDTLTVQAYKTTYTETTFLYELAWYVHPFTEDLVYTVYLHEQSGNPEVRHDGYATAMDGETGYQAFESEVEYVSAQLVLENGLTMEVPVVEKTPFARYN
jgi:hypothetical protein